MISAVILAKDEEKHIQAAINSVSFCSEVLVIDNNSTDRTVSFARNAGATVISDTSEDFSVRRNGALEKVTNDWVLFMDADERIPDELVGEIVEAVQNPNISAYYLRRHDIFWRRSVIRGEVRGAYQQGIIRLMKKGCGKWVGKVHETFETGDAVGTLQTPLDHYAHEGIHDFLYAINGYSTLRAQELFEQGRRTNALDIMGIPFVKFIYTYFLLRGFRDGAVGFVYSFMMSFHSFLVRGKLYLLWASNK